jgi:selenocysteine-specific elongation factor
VPASDPGPAAGPPVEAPLTLGTAGHIDHGKTALVTRLTGTNTDRLREERERGISIELGYAELELPDGRRLSVVDVPGHERFVRTMVAGATGIDLFLLVVAADDAVMPQTVEHLAVIELLGVERGVVALTKADLVDDELLALARADVEQFLAGTPYAGTPIVAVSARDGRGLPELLAALAAAAAEVAGRRRDGPARLPVDRVFVLKGIGVVATGTLWRGVVRPGDRLVVVPGGATVTVRGVQTHDQAIEAASAGRRVALNLRGAERAGLERGVVLVSPARAEAVPPARSFAAAARLIAGARPLRTGERVRLHHGTAQHVARLSFLDRRELAPGEGTIASSCAHCRPDTRSAAASCSTPRRAAFTSAPLSVPSCARSRPATRGRPAFSQPPIAARPGSARGTSPPPASRPTRRRPPSAPSPGRATSKASARAAS